MLASYTTANTVKFVNAAITLYVYSLVHKQLPCSLYVANVTHKTCDIEKLGGAWGQSYSLPL